MKVSKSLASLLAAAAVAGSIGLAYAQTTDSTTAPAPAPDTSMQNQSGAPGGMTSPATESAGMQTERPAQADRN